MSSFTLPIMQSISGASASLTVSWWACRWKNYSYPLVKIGSSFFCLFLLVPCNCDSSCNYFILEMGLSDWAYHDSLQQTTAVKLTLVLALPHTHSRK